MTSPDGKKKYKLYLNRKRILHLKTVKEILEFHEKYKYAPNFEIPSRMYSINWKRVARKYHGIEISPYQWNLRFNLLWYYGWDCSSGCVWNKKAIRKIRKA